MKMYGTLPEDLGKIDLNPTEMLFWLYCPIQTPSSLLTVPPNLKHFMPIIDAVLDNECSNLDEKYVYLTAKTLYVSPGNIGNRPGWHSDGFGSDDVNYIWYDRAPTEFLFTAMPFTLPDNCENAMELMGMAAENGVITEYTSKQLLRLTSSNIHRCPEHYAAGMRTFVKVSISKDEYNLEGNSINHALVSSHWPLLKRRDERNHPHDTATRYDEFNKSL